MAHRVSGWARLWVCLVRFCCVDAWLHINHCTTISCLHTARPKYRGYEQKSILHVSYKDEAMWRLSIFADGRQTNNTWVIVSQ